MKNEKRNIIIACIVCAGVMVIASLVFMGAVIYDITFGYEETNDVKAFSGRDGLISWDEDTDYFSYLLGFPDSTEDIVLEEFLYREQSALFDTPYQIFLRYTASEIKYEEEKERLSNIAISYNGEEKHPIYIEDINGCSVYVMAYEIARSYEYVILNDDKNEIVCVFVQAGYLSESKIPQQYWIEPTQIEEIPENYSMYYFEKEPGTLVMPDLEGKAVEKMRIMYSD